MKKIFAFTILSAALFLSSSVDAREIKRSGDGKGHVQKTITGRDGKTMKVDKNIKRNQDGWSATGTRTNQDGKTRTFEQTSTKTEDGRSFSGTTTLDNGKTVTRESDVTKTEDGWSRTTTQTGPNGQTRTWSKTRSQNQ